MRNITAFLLVVFISGSAKAYSSEIFPSDELRPYRAGFGLGCSFAGLRDEIESPINRYVNALTGLIDGNIQKGIFFHSLYINFFMGSSKMPAPYRGYNKNQYISARGFLEYALDCRLWGNEIFPGFLGGSLRTCFSYTGVGGINSGNNDLLAAPTGVMLTSADVHLTQKWIINRRNSVDLSLEYPLLGYGIRPAYAGFDELWMKYLYENALKIATLGKFISFHNYWAVYGELKYHYKITPLISPYSCLGFELFRINFPRPRVEALFQVNAGIAFTF